MNQTAAEEDGKLLASLTGLFLLVGVAAALANFSHLQRLYTAFLEGHATLPALMGRRAVKAPRTSESVRTKIENRRRAEKVKRRAALQRS